VTAAGEETVASTASEILHRVSHRSRVIRT
jgi:hypothetical protein